jgi:hypothetical protein
MTDTRPFAELWRIRRLLFPRKARSYSEAGQPNPIGRSTHKNIAQFDILVNKAAFVQAAKCVEQAYSEPQKLAEVFCWNSEPTKRSGAWCLEHQNGLAALSHKLQRPDRPGAIEIVPQPVFVGETSDCSRRWTLCGGAYGH